MAWLVDTSILLDIGLDDPDFAEASEELLAAKRPEGLLVTPVVFVELAPTFAGQITALETFLFQLGVEHREEWHSSDTLRACEAWNRHIQNRHTNPTPKRPIADILIGACALRHQGLLTRNPADFRKLFPSLTLLQP